MKDMKRFKNILILLIGLILLGLRPALGVGSTEEQPLDVEEFGSIAELYQALSPDMPFEEYLQRVLKAKEMILKKKVSQDTHISYQNLISALKILYYVRDRFRQIEKMRAQFYMRPARAISPRKSVSKNPDGSYAISYTGFNYKIAKHILRNYSKRFPEVSKDDIREIEKRIDETKGKKTHKAFTITFGAKDKDKLDNYTRFPVQMSFRNEVTHFPDWNFSKAIANKFMYDKDLNPTTWEDITYNFVRFDKCAGQWWGFNNRETNAFGWAVETYQEVYNLKTEFLYTTKQEVLEMDFNIREARRTHRLTHEIWEEGGIDHNYEEEVNVLEYKKTTDDEGKDKYLPTVVEVRHYNDNQIPTGETITRSFYTYDDNDRIINSVIVTHTRSQDGSIAYNSLRITKVTLFDPITGLTSLEEDSYEIPFIAGPFDQMVRRGEIIHRALEDSELQDLLKQCGLEDKKYQIADEIALGVLEGMEYDAAKIDVVARYKGGREEEEIAVAARSLIQAQSSEEVEEITRQLQELKKLYGDKILLTTQ
jgi:hypothetical protein